MEFVTGFRLLFYKSNRNQLSGLPSLSLDLHNNFYVSPKNEKKEDDTKILNLQKCTPGGGWHS